MKKQSIFTIIALVAAFVMSSCNSYKAKEVKLSNENDSLNYTLGLANGDGIKNYYLHNDSTDKPIVLLLKAIDEAYSSDKKEDEMYKLGMQIGNSLKKQKKSGLMGDSTLVFNQGLVEQGLINALRNYKEGMTPDEAEKYLHKVMSELQQKNMQSHAPVAPKVDKPKADESKK
ncbi:MAG: FKBP-type peptidyl-prolyl cis-trans isomerase N-terminal domain-containing protein [Paludibacter sp.]|nr:FKBP-type peptidyl-prolyl cis-trans isomerase N-terminal domain-containing protein [Paludibacter sp.]